MEAQIAEQEDRAIDAEMDAVEYLAELLSNPSGHFSQLVDDTGSGHAVHLRELAVKAGEAQRAAAVGISRPVSPSHTRPASPDQWRGE